MEQNTTQPHYCNHIFFRRMRIVMICVALCLCCAGSINAQVYSYGASSQSSYELPTYSPYQSTIYRPFSGAVPSQKSTGPSSGDPVGQDVAGSNGTPGTPGEGDDDIFNDEFPDGFHHPDDPNPAYQEPVGEAWVMLFFAAVMAAGMYLRQRKTKLQLK